MEGAFKVPHAGWSLIAGFFDEGNVPAEIEPKPLTQQQRAVPPRVHFESYSLERKVYFDGGVRFAIAPYDLGPHNVKYENARAPAPSPAPWRR